MNKKTSFLLISLLALAGTAHAQSFGKAAPDPAPAVQAPAKAAPAPVAAPVAVEKPAAVAKPAQVVEKPAEKKVAKKPVAVKPARNPDFASLVDNKPQAHTSQPAQVKVKRSCAELKTTDAIFDCNLRTPDVYFGGR